MGEALRTKLDNYEKMNNAKLCELVIEMATLITQLESEVRQLSSLIEFGEEVSNGRHEAC